MEDLPAELICHVLGALQSVDDVVSFGRVSSAFIQRQPI